jgi:FtsH-binding integral membrane protein
MIEISARAHISRVTRNLAGSFALTAALAMLTSRLDPPRLSDNVAIRVAIITVLIAFCVLISRYIRLHNELLIQTGAIKTTSSLLFGYAGLIGVASGVTFTPEPLFSVARVFLVVAASFAAASLWGCGMRRKRLRWLPRWAENAIVSEIVIFGGIAISFLVELIVWPSGIEYLKYASGFRATFPDAATSGAYEWVVSLFVLAYFGLALGSYARTIAWTYSPSWDRNTNSVPRSLFTSIFPALILPNPAPGYVPLTRPHDKDAESHVAVLGAFAIYSRILLPLTIAALLFLTNSRSLDGNSSRQAALQTAVMSSAF